MDRDALIGQNLQVAATKSIVLGGDTHWNPSSDNYTGDNPIPYFNVHRNSMALDYMSK
ncbi:hypothetical protein L195_g024725 [Trifolium pratense]|uniref:Uncharacterized protein n=1 Tax=Trifolium pratense TaxID=57577 RepID=A0A2K3NEH1_TRIPR|nr:hypothetical protein L195_g024725 [Trifolium pratense]